MNRIQGHRGFTLIELLVVIAIMVILMSLLLPGIARMRERTKTVVCASNMRQVAAAIIQYANDREGTLPPFQTIASQMGYNSNWAAELVTNGYLDAPIALSPNDVPSRSIFRCPTGRSDGIWDGSTPSDPWSFTNAHLRPWAAPFNAADGTLQYVHTWFGINGRTEPDGSRNRGYPFHRPWAHIPRSTHILHIKPLENMVMIFDGFWSHNIVPNRITARHGLPRAYTNIAYMDGRVETTKTRIFAVTDQSDPYLVPRFRNL